MQLTKRDFKAKYKRSTLGALWSVLNPLLNMAVLAIIFSRLFANDIESFPAYLICGQTIYSFFSDSTSMALGSIVHNATFVRRVYVPLYMIPLSRIMSSLINLALSLIAMVVIVFATGVKPSLTMLLFPIPLIYEFFFCFGIGMLLSAGMVFFRDLSHLYGVLTFMLMYLSCIFYPETIIPEQYAFLLQMNPVFHFIKMFRNVMIYNTLPTFTEHFICFTFCVAALAAGTVFFRKNQHKFILYV